MEAKPDQLDDLTVPISYAARVLGLGDERLRQLVKAGHIPKAARGRVPFVAAVQGYVRFLQDEARISSKTAAASRMHDARTAEIELRVSERRRELVPVEDAYAALDLVLGTIREELDGFPKRATRDLALRRTLEEEIDASLNRVADTLGASAEFLEKGGELPTAGGEDDA